MFDDGLLKVMLGFYAIIGAGVAIGLWELACFLARHISLEWV